MESLFWTILFHRAHLYQRFLDSAFIVLLGVLLACCSPYTHAHTQMHTQQNHAPKILGPVTDFKSLGMFEYITEMGRMS